MIQLYKNDTILKFFSSLLTLQLLFLPLVYDHLPAATQQVNEMTIAHFPARVGRYGQQVTVRAHIAEKTPVRKVILVVENGASPLRGAMPKVQQAGLVPVKVKATKQAGVRTGAAPSKNIKGRLEMDEIMQVAGEKNGYYYGVSEFGMKGYVDKNDVTVVDTGEAYAVTLPSDITSRSTLTYHIEAVDADGRITRTETVSMRLLTDEEIDMFMSMYGGGAVVPDTPLYKKPLFWASMAALAGGAYLLSSDKESENDNQTTVEVLVDWE
jgi:hypothetical protein